MLIRLNVAIAVYRERSVLRDNPLLEVIGFTAITATVSFLVSTLHHMKCLAHCPPSTDHFPKVCSASFVRIRYLKVLCRVQSSDLVAALFQECDPTKVDFHGVCK
jgi:chloride channel 3/4/5